MKSHEVGYGSLDGDKSTRIRKSLGEAMDIQRKFDEIMGNNPSGSMTIEQFYLLVPTINDVYQRSVLGGSSRLIRDLHPLSLPRGGLL